MPLQGNSAEPGYAGKKCRACRGGFLVAMENLVPQTDPTFPALFYVEKAH